MSFRPLMNLKRRIASASALNFVDYGLKAAVVLVVSPFLIGRLGKEEYGLWVLLLSVIGYLDLLDLGLNQTAVRYLSLASGAGNVDAEAQMFCFFRNIYKRIGMVSLGVTVIAMVVLPYVATDDTVVRKSRIIIGMGGMMMSGSFVFRIYSALLKSRVLYYKLIIAGIVRLLIYTGLMVVILMYHGGLIALALAWTTGLTIELAMIWMQARRLVPVSQSLNPVPPSKIREIKGFAGKTLGGVLAGFMRDRVDTQILGSHLGTISVTHYAVGSRLIMMFSDVINALFGGHFLAAFAQVHARGGREGAVETLLNTIRISAPIALSGGICIFVLGPTFIDHWLGAGFEESHAVVRILAFPVALAMMQYPLGPYLGSMNRHGMMAAVSMFGGAFNLILSLLLVRWVGFPGVVIATAVELSLTGLILWPWLLVRSGGVELKRYVWVLARPIIVLLPVAWGGGLLLSDWLAMSAGVAKFGLAAVALCLGLAVASWFGILNRSEKNFALSKFRLPS